MGPLLANLMRRLPPHKADALLRKARRRELGDLSEYGLPIPEEGVFSRLRRLEVAPAIVDKETLEAIKDGRIEMVAAVDALDESGLKLADGTRVEPDAVLAATGYRCGLEPMVGHLGLLDDRGVPRVREGREAAPGLRFVGYRPLPGHIGHMGAEAKGAAREIARSFAAAPGTRRVSVRPRRVARAG